ncbi:PilZ domain-containing protein [Clostridium sp. BJN0001]|uniref:flagellar brake protein n=1 Tax=Clostridium sp. BJN0001 TaxID=2930219 RepID=UPI001FD278A9|nr:PilZ domain-containing protein [Clostridium sp. BJN0001]
MEGIGLEVNTKLEIQGEKKGYKSIVLDVSDENFMINIPVSDGEYMLLHIGEEVEINCYLENGRCYNFFSKVTGKGKERNILYYRLSTPFNIRKIQRRNFFRVSVIKEVKYKIITNLNKEEINDLQYRHATLIDLSGGGLKIKIKEKIQKGEKIQIKFKVKNTELELKGEVVRLEYSEYKERVCGIKFIDITQCQSDKIIEELFCIMRKQRANL